MKNYQKYCYSNYQVMAPDGECTKVTRTECFATPTPPTADNPYPQRWYYDPESGLVIRLPRNMMGSVLARRNAADLRTEERQRKRQYSCAGRSGEVQCSMRCSKCPMNVNCVLTHRATDGVKCRKKCEICFQPVGRYLGLINKPRQYNPAIEVDKALLKALFSALDRITPEYRELWDCLTSKTKKRDIAKRLHITIDGVRYREQKLFDQIRADEGLKNFFSKT